MYRDTETHLRAEHYFIGNNSTKCLLEDIFLVVESLQLEVERDFRGKLEELVIKKRGAPFEGDRHGIDVHFDHEVIGEIGREIGVDGLLRLIQTPGFGESIGDNAV